MVITGRTRNAVVRKGSWVRIPPPPPDNGMWLSLVEHYVRDVGAAGSNPVIPTITSVLIGFKKFYENTRFLCRICFILLHRLLCQSEHLHLVLYGL